MELNNKVLEQISEITGADIETLKNALINENASIELPKLYKESDIETLTKNVQKEAYDTGKNTGVEMQLKALKQAYKDKGIDTDGIKDYDTLIDTVLKKSLSDVSNMTKKEREVYESEKTELQKLIEAKDNEINTEKARYSKFVKESKTEQIIKSEFDKINFDVPKHIAIKGADAIGEFLQKERKKAEILFKSAHQIDFDENGNIILKQGENILKDELKNPLTINKVLPNFLNEYNLVTISEKPIGRGQNYSNRQTDDNFTGMSKSEFDAHVKSKGIKTGISTEYTALYKKWKQDNE